MSVYTISFRAMGSQISAWLAVPSREQATILEQVPQWFAEWEGALSRFLPDSELNQLNRLSGSWVSVSPVLAEVVEAARYAAALTHGLVTPLILPALEAAGYTHSFAPDQAELEARPPAGPTPDWRAINVDLASNSVYLPDGARIDLGGVAKGWAAQVTADRLAAVGACLVDAGGDMVGRGTPDEQPGWIVNVPCSAEATGAIDTTAATDAVTPIWLCDAAIATSGTDYRHWIQAGQPRHHIIDPASGQPADTNVVTATVIAPDAIMAEAFAKAALISGDLPLLPTVLHLHDGNYLTNQSFAELKRRITC